MDNTVTAKFFRVTGEAAAPEFVAHLDTIFAKALVDRESDINPGTNNPVIVRLERLAHDDADYVTGELIRKQVRNIPPEANDEGLEPIELSEGGGLGYSSAFIFHRPTRVILIQSNPIAVTYSRLAMYTVTHNPAANYRFDPIPTDEAWDRFNRGLPRKLVVRIASPEAVAGLPAAAGTVAGSAADVSEAMNGAYITIEVSMGNKKGSLDVNAVRNLIRTFRQSEEVDVRHLSASVKPDGSGTDVIDFLEEYLVFKDVFDLPENDAERSYTMRRDILRNAFGNRLEYIQAHYGAAPAVD